MSINVLVNAISARAGGIVTYTSNLIRSLAQRQVAATFVVPEQFPVPEGGRALRVSAGELPAARRFIWEQTLWRRRVARIAPDVLLSSANFALLRSPVPQALLIREGGLFDPFYLVNVAPSQGLEALLRRNLRRQAMLTSARAADRIITPSQTMADLLCGWDPRLATKLAIIRYGTLIDTFRPSSARRPWRSDGVLRPLFVSVYYPHKNPSVLCRAAEALTALGLKTVATITMNLAEIATTPGSVMDHVTLEWAQELGLVQLGRHGYRELPAVYDNHDVFVFPSVSETFGHPMVEAMSSGLPVVAADTLINREICGDAALYHSPFSGRSLMECLQALDNNPELRAELADRGRRRVLKMFDWDRHVDEILGVLEAVKR